MKKTFVSMFMAVFLLGATSAMAAPIQTWDYILEYGFLNDWTETNSDASNAVAGSIPNDNDNFTKLSWGSPANFDPHNNTDQSAIYVDPGNSDGVYTLLESQLAMTFSHDNNILVADNENSTLETATLYSYFSLLSTEGGPPAATRNFWIEFWETPNDTIGGVPGWQHDFFWLKNPEDLTFDFTIGDYVYHLEFWIDGLQNFNDHDRASELRTHFLEDANDTDTSFVGLQTTENGTTSFQSYFKLTASPVPEPTTFVLFGVGLLGCSALVRRRQYR